MTSKDLRADHVVRCTLSYQTALVPPKESSYLAKIENWARLSINTEVEKATNTNQTLPPPPPRPPGPHQRSPRPMGYPYTYPPPQRTPLDEPPSI